MKVGQGVRGSRERWCSKKIVQKDGRWGGREKEGGTVEGRSN